MGATVDNFGASPWTVGAERPSPGLACVMFGFAMWTRKRNMVASASAQIALQSPRAPPDRSSCSNITDWPWSGAANNSSGRLRGVRLGRCRFGQPDSTPLKSPCGRFGNYPRGGGASAQRASPPCRAHTLRASAEANDALALVGRRGRKPAGRQCSPQRHSYAIGLSHWGLLQPLG
jgi:hypothetical protein